MKDNKALTVAEFLYKNIYCRYLSPGECIIHDYGGEFTANVQKKLAKDFGVDMRCIKAGRPWANGQAESAVKKVKTKLKLLALENGDDNQIPRDWDGVILHNALQILRCDPTQATGFAPAELMIGRPLVYPIEFSRCDLDFSGTNLTTPLVQSLRLIRQENFSLASKKILKAQRRYKKQYDKKMNAKPFAIKIGDRVQYLRYKSKNTLSKSELTLWCPAKSYHLVLCVNYEKKVCILQDKAGNKLDKTQPFSRIRKYKGKF